MHLVYVAMGVVVAGWFLLTLTSANAELHKRHALRMTALGVWLLIVAVGWMSFAYIAYGTSGGLDGAWQWVLAQSLPLRIAMWLFLLPYMGALGIWQLSWVVWQKTVVIVVLALATFLLSLKRG